MTLDLLLKAIDYVIKLCEKREAKERDRLTLVYEPLFSALREINSDYVRMFEELRTALPTALERGSDRYRTEVQHTCRLLRELRTRMAGSREEVAAMSARLSLRDDLTTQERAFLLAVVTYLPLGMAGEGSSTNGPQEAGTRATALEKALYSGSMQLESPDVAALIARSLRENSRSWQELCAQFADLKVHAASIGRPSAG